MSLLSDLVAHLSFDEFRTFIQGLATTEGRLAVSGVILLGTVLVAVVLAPFLIGRLGTQMRKRLPNGRTLGVVDLLTEYVPTTVSSFLLRIVQIVVVGVAVLALLVVWGLVDVAVTVLQIVGVSLPMVAQILITVLLFLCAYIAADITRDAVVDLSEETQRVTEHQQEIIIRMANVGLLAFVVTAALTLWGVNLSGLLVGAGFLGIVVGMAARQTLGSMLAGFVLMFSRPFTIGDWVEIGENEGIVTDITIMNTRLRNFDGESIVIPNDMASNRAVTNRSEQGHLRIRTQVGIDYESDPDYAETVALDAIERIDAVVDSPPPDVVPVRFGDSAVILELRFWIDRPSPPRRWRATREVIYAIKRRFDEEDIDIPFPQRELSTRTDHSGVRIGYPESGSGEGQRGSVSED